MNTPDLGEKEAIDQQRIEILEEYENWTEIPGLVLGLAWLVLLVIDLVWRLNPFLNITFTAIWILFIIDFLIRFFLAPKKILYLKRNFLTAISLVIPALRVFRIFAFLRFFRFARAVRGINLLRVVTSANRGMKALRSSFGKQGFPYVLALTAIITLLGAGGMLAFERGHTIQTYGDALWWTAMIMTTMGSDTWPQTGEGRLLAFLLALYAFAIFGYITATLASFFIGQRNEEQVSNPEEPLLLELREEILALRAEVHRLSSDQGEQPE